MLKDFFRVLFVSLAVALASVAQAQKPAEMALRNGVVYTASADGKRAEAIAIADGRIVYVGDNRGVAAFIGAKTKIIDLKGKMVLPGFQDSHVHLISGGLSLMSCNLHQEPQNATVAQALADIKNYVKAHPKAKWIQGGGWAMPLFKDANPRKTILDRLVPNRPAYLEAEDGHSAWVNSAALKLAKITKDTPDPKNGRIERDPKTGEPTGTLREDAMGLVGSLIPPHSDAEMREGLRRGLKEANQFGITSIQDASADVAKLKAYAALDKTGELTVKVTAAYPADASRGPEQVAEIEEVRRKFVGKRLRVTTVKIFADGVLESKTAALLEPYLNGKKDERGLPNYTPEALNALVAACDAAGFQVHTHAVGDRASRMTLDALEEARAVSGPKDLRHHIAHLEFVDPADIPRFKELGVIANFQPFWAYEDSYIKDITAPNLGPARSRWLRPIGSVKKTGAIIAFGSDWPVTTLNPIYGIHVAVTRRGPEQGAGKPWIPQEVISLSDALDAYTSHGAYVQFQEKETGSLEVGKAADLIVLDRNLFTTPPAQIAKAKILLTLLDGKPVYRAPKFRQQK